MKKRKILLLGLIALMLAGGLMLASCFPRCPDVGICKGTYVPNAIIQDLPEECSNGCITKQKTQEGTPTSKETWSCNC
jgi:hypothetical protein